MFSGCRGMNSYPYQSNHMPPIHYYNPNWQAKENPTGPVIHEPWPQYYGCAVPMQCPSCANHGHYYFNPHCQHVPPPPAHYYGGYPAYPRPYNVSYVPPPHYTMDLPRYEYDKSVPSEFHCCGCPNHPRYSKEDNSITIEEHEPDAETKKSESLVAGGANMNNSPYPIMWIPPGFMTNKEKLRSAEKEADDKQVSPYVIKPQWLQRPLETGAKKHEEAPPVKQSTQSVEQDPNVRHGWFPLDIDSLRQLIEGGVGAKTLGQESKNVGGENAEDVENKDQHKQSPYNIIWLPSGGHGDEGKIHAGTVPAEKASTTFEDVPNKSEHPDNEAEKKATTVVNDNISKVGTQPTAAKVKTIPVKQLESVESKELKEDGAHIKSMEEVNDNIGKVGTQPTAAKVKTIPVKQLESVESKELKEDGAHVKSMEKHARNGANVQSMSPTKKSKLPPICLRVDPPKKKNGNGSSRSPSSSGDKKKQSPDDSNTCEKTEAKHPSKKDIKVAEAEDEKPNHEKIKLINVTQNENKGSTLENKPTVAQEKALPEVDGGNVGVTVRGDDKEVVQMQNSQSEKESKCQEASKPKKKSLSETESATIIQSAYRGFEVRRWEPLKKLRQIAKVREEVHELKKHVEDLVSNAGCSTDKEKTAIGETIMKLLLKLDTIQGMLPSVRDFRRCVAKELIVLQEKLDSITSQNAAFLVQETVTVEESAKPSCVVEGSKDDAESEKESSSIDSSQVEGSEANSETAYESLKDSCQVEGSADDVKTSDESSKNCLQDESSHTVEKVSILDEGSQEADMIAKSIEEEELAHSVNEVPLCQPLMTHNVVCGSENKETLEASPVSVDSQTRSSDEVTISSTGCLSELAAVDSSTDTKKSESDFSEQPSGKLSGESQELAIGTKAVEDDAKQNDATFENEKEAENLLAELPRELSDYEEVHKDSPGEEAENLLAELPREVIDYDEVHKECPQTEHEMCSTLGKEPPKDATGPTFAPEAAVVDSAFEDKDVEVYLPAELPRDIPDQVVEESTSKVSSSEILNRSPEMNVKQSSENCESKPEELQTTETGSCKLDKLPCEAQVSNESETADSTIDIDIAIVEQDVPRLKEQIVEDAVPAGEGLSVSELMLKQKEQIDNVELISVTAGVPSQRQETYCGHGNAIANDHLVGSETVKQDSYDRIKYSESEAQQFKDEDETSELSTESQGSVVEAKNEQEINKKIIEENERLKEMLDKLITYGKQQQQLISTLSGKVEDLEKRLAKKKTSKETKRPRVKISRSMCGKYDNGLSRERSMGVAS